MADLLPPNATDLERLLSEAAARLGDVEIPIPEQWNADTIAAENLPWLAWAFGVDEWNAEWSDEQQREFIKGSLAVHQHKGTIGAIKAALAGLLISAEVQEWFNQSPAGVPYTFRVILEAFQYGIEQEDMGALYRLIGRTKNLRSHLSELALRARSDATARMAAVAAVGSEIVITRHVRPASLVLNSVAICV